MFASSAIRGGLALVQSQKSLILKLSGRKIDFRYILCRFCFFFPVFAVCNRAPPCPAAPVSGTLLPLLRIFPGNPSFYLFFPTGGVPQFFAALPSPAAAGNKGAFFRQVTIILFTPSRQLLSALPPLFSLPKQCETIAIFPKTRPYCPCAAFILLNHDDIPLKLKRNTRDCSAVFEVSRFQHCQRPSTAPLQS